MARDRLYPPSVTPGIPKLGKMPHHWMQTTFGDVLSVAKRPIDIQDDLEYQLVTAKRNRGGIVARGVLTGRQIFTKTQFYLKPNDFVISKRQIIHGACGIVPVEFDGAIVSNEYSILRVKEGLLLDYLNYLTHTTYFQQTCFQSSVGVDVEKMIFDLNEWLKYKIYLPPLPEQSRIIAILGAWDTAVAITEQLLTTKYQLKKGLMQVLLTGKKRFKRFKQSDWESIEFGKFVCKENRKFDPKIATSHHSCIELEHIEQGTGRILGHVSTRQRKSIKSFFKSGQILFGKLRPYLKKYAHPNFDGVCSSEIWVLSGKKDKCDNHFLFYLVQTNDFIRAANVTSGTKMPRADWENVSECVFALPKLDEQLKIVAALQACDSEITLLTQKLAALRAQKKGLMQQLLTGKVRVKV
jgi:type I restriction enzyme, S subunit